MEIFSLLPITFAIFCLLPWLDSIPVKQSNACQGENKTTYKICTECIIWEALSLFLWGWTQSNKGKYNYFIVVRSSQAMKFKRDEIGSSELCNVVGLYWTHPIKSFSQPVTEAIFRWLEQNEGSDVPRSHNLKNDLIDAHLKNKKNKKIQT